MYQWGNHFNLLVLKDSQNHTEAFTETLNTDPEVRSKEEVNFEYSVMHVRRSDRKESKYATRLKK